MRPAVRLFQAAAAITKHTPRLVAYHPTGITGVVTHPLPRPTLLNIYNSTLRDLSKLPEESAYRTATEAIVKHRKRIVEEQVPVGFEAYCKDLESRGLDSPPKYDDQIEKLNIKADQILATWGDWEGTTNDDRDLTDLIKEKNLESFEKKKEEWEKLNGRPLPRFEGKEEPDLSAEQVEVIEQQIGCGLIEELIIQAYEEYKLVGVIAESKAWEPLMEEPVEGQWTYFDRQSS